MNKIHGSWKILHIKKGYKQKDEVLKQNRNGIRTALHTKLLYIKDRFDTATKVR